MRKAYAGIGSRETPEQALKLMTALATMLEGKGFLLRSGGADGADTAFEKGCKYQEIFLPWRNFNGRTSGFWDVSQQALDIAAKYHPGWNYLSEGARKLMGRNVYQVLGQSLNDPVDFVVCWTPDGCEGQSTRSRKTGGTGQAIAIADSLGIPVMNLKNENALSRILHLVELYK